ncbi:methyltransferase family protein [Stenomitos frigidus]|uniref:Protein-S-isoprenylcysteine methyltransferase n=1 Tax=Stenomitos frigidus ULC18 TaxID=2107698 RepID=A0A2T1E351_9CYAN|nr:isoprenylcysteine carboxylmethyltransferase family protein [Stenomitos frigidus]PSB27168.1 protein-S-isoprenylcysteine methyltransferase [Stenomitos frigidus ULC18]
MSGLETKIPPPLVAVLFGLGMWALATVFPVVASSSVRIVSAAVVAIAAAVFALSGIVSFRQAKTTINPVNPEKASSLVCSGIYGVSRNPMYVGLALLLVAWAVYLSSLWSLVGVFGFILYVNRFQITPEERTLTTLFGDQFLSYQAKVRRWL